jgi:hypothetical protein
MPTPEEEQLNANIELLLKVQMKGMNNLQRLKLESSIKDIKDEIKKLRNWEKRQNTTRMSATP